MTQLFIDGMEAVLSANFSCKSVSENPFFTKAGDYTLNINLSLENPINAKIYKHMNRINSLSRFENRTAILIADNEVVIKGKEVVLKYSNRDVEIQIVAGNSSLNYLIGNDLQLRDLDMGSASITPSTIVSDLNQKYPNKNWLLLPFYDPDRKFIGNRYTFHKNSQNRYELRYAYNNEFLNTLGFYNDKLFNHSEWLIKYENYRPQPFFCFIIDKVFHSLGYNLLSNALAQHEIYKTAYIVHAQDTLSFAKMLPDWSVEKFLSEIENLFDCTVLVNNELMEAEIVFNHNYYHGAHEADPVMLDDFEADIEESAEKMIYEKNVGYNLPDTTYYRFQNLPDALREKMNRRPPTPGHTVDQAIKSHGREIAALDINNRRYVANQCWTVGDLKLIDVANNNKVTAFQVDDYRPMKNNADSDTVDWNSDIIPAEFVVMPYYIRERLSFDLKSYTMYQMPVARCEEEPVITASSGNQNIFPRVEDFVEGNETAEQEKSVSGYQQLSLAFYHGMHWTNSNEGPALNFDKLPFMYVRMISENFDRPTNDFLYVPKYNGRYDNPLAFRFLKNEFYIKNQKIDRKKIYKIKFLKPVRKIDPKQLFVIGNRKFYCKKIERTITIDGFNEIVEGEFYAEKD